jgi:hemerythrin superfamily protein
MSSDAITLLKQDHKEVKALFREFQKRRQDQTRKGQLVSKMIELLTVHTYIENECMYPEVRVLLPELEADVWNPTRNTTSPTSCSSSWPP